MLYQQQEKPLLGLFIDNSNQFYSGSDMLHFPAVPKGVELVQPQADVLLLAPGDLLDLALLADQLLNSNSLKQFFPSIYILKF